MLRAALDRLFPGYRYRRTLEAFDTRIGVSGIRGKSSCVRWIHEALDRRGYDSHAKITGDYPILLHGDETRDIGRGGAQVSLYENQRLLYQALAGLDDADVDEGGDARDVLAAEAVFENHAIGEYTMRVFNDTFLDADLVVLLNVRQDHNSTLGRTRQEIARSFARSIPEGCHVISGERHPAIHDYLAAEVEKRGGTIERVAVPEPHRELVGAEVVHCTDAVLRHVDDEGLPPERVQALLAQLQPVWWELGDDARVCNAAKVNDVESTELVRRALAGDQPDADLVCPFVFCREDRRGRTASFVRYVNALHERGLIDRVHVGGAQTAAFARNVAPPTTVHDTAHRDAAEVLDALLATEQPVVFMANTVHPFMRALVAETKHRMESASAIEVTLEESGDGG